MLGVSRPRRRLGVARPRCCSCSRASRGVTRPAFGGSPCSGAARPRNGTAVTRRCAPSLLARSMLAACLASPSSRHKNRAVKSRGRLHSTANAVSLPRALAVGTKYAVRVSCLSIKQTRNRAVKNIRRENDFDKDEKRVLTFIFPHSSSAAGTNLLSPCASSIVSRADFALSLLRGEVTANNGI